MVRKNVPDNRVCDAEVSSAEFRCCSPSEHSKKYRYIHRDFMASAPYFYEIDGILHIVMWARASLFRRFTDRIGNMENSPQNNLAYTDNFYGAQWRVSGRSIDILTVSRDFPISNTMAVGVTRTMNRSWETFRRVFVKRRPAADMMTSSPVHFLSRMRTQSACDQRLTGMRY